MTILIATGIVEAGHRPCPANTSWLVQAHSFMLIRAHYSFARISRIQLCVCVTEMAQMCHGADAKSRGRGPALTMAEYFSFFT